MLINDGRKGLKKLILIYTNVTVQSFNDVHERVYIEFVIYNSQKNVLKQDLHKMRLAKVFKYQISN